MQVRHVLGHLEEICVNEAHRIVDLVRDTRGELADRGHLFGLQNLALQQLDLGEIREHSDRPELVPGAIGYRSARDPDRHQASVGSRERALEALEALSRFERARDVNFVLWDSRKPGPDRSPAYGLRALAEDFLGRRVGKDDLAVQIDHQQCAVEILDDVLVVTLEIADSALGHALVTRGSPALDLFQSDYREYVRELLPRHHAVRGTSLEGLECEGLTIVVVDHDHGRARRFHLFEQLPAFRSESRIRDDQVDRSIATARTAGSGALQGFDSRVGAQSS